MTSERNDLSDRAAYLTVFHVSPIAASIARAADGSFLEVNEVYRQNFGWTREEIVGRTSADIGLWTVEACDAWATALHDAGELRDYETVWRNRAGQRRNVSISATLIDFGGERCILALINDVTARRHTEDELLESEHQFSRIFRTSPVAISITRLADGRYVEINNAYVRQFGWDREEMIGRTSLDIGLWAEADKRRVWAEVVHEHGGVAGYEATMRDRYGKERVILISAERFEFGGEDCVLSFLHDITERKRAEADVRRLNAELEDRVRRRTSELTEVNRELEAFAYSISHDLRAPLRGIDGFSRLLLEEYGDRLDAQGHDYLTRVRRAAQRLGALIDDLLELSRVTRQEMRRHRVDLSALAADILDELARAEPARVVETRVAPGCLVQGDPQLLRVLLENLLGNAWKYSRPHPAPRIEFGREQGYGETRYFVRDNGVGFDMTYVGKLFSPFQRLHKPSEFEGSGIGLASAARIVRRHGGTIAAESRPGDGAMFSFSLGPNA